MEPEKEKGSSSNKGYKLGVSKSRELVKILYSAMPALPVVSRSHPLLVSSGFESEVEKVMHEDEILHHFSISALNSVSSLRGLGTRLPAVAPRGARHTSNF